MEEIWKDIDGYDGCYRVSNFGRVKSLEREQQGNRNSVQKCTEMIMKPYQRNDSYFTVNLSKNGKIKVSRVHRLVACAFIPNLENKPSIDHIDGNTSNNEISNLRWCTHKENMNNPIHSKRRAVANKNRDYSKINKRGKFVAQIDINTGVEIAQFISARDAARKTNTDYTNIGKCCNGHKKTAGGYMWKFV